MHNTMDMHLIWLMAMNMICLIESHALRSKYYNMVILICLVMFLPF